MHAWQEREPGPCGCHHSGSDLLDLRPAARGSRPEGEHVGSGPQRADPGRRNHCAYRNRATRPPEQGFRLVQSAQSARSLLVLMHSLSRALLATATLFLSVTGIAAAQTTPLSRQLSRIDFGISGVGQLTGTVSGPIVPTGASNAG